MWQCIMFFGLQVDRGNLAQAVSDNMLDDLGLDTNGKHPGHPHLAPDALADATQTTIMATVHCYTLKLPSAISMFVRDPEPLLSWAELWVS